MNFEFRFRYLKSIAKKKRKGEIPYIYKDSQNRRDKNYKYLHSQFIQ